jgi:protein-S-isoprenylcysteine O-methyltransferase Ste14
MSNASAKWTRWRVPLAYPLAIACFYFAKPTWWSLVEGATVAFAGLVIRGAAAGVLHKGAQLATSGIYAWTRNPLYFGSTILALGCAIAAHSWIVVVVVAAYFAVFYPAIILREESFLRERFGTDFEQYKSRVSVFVPWPSSSSTAGQAFSWNGYRRNHEMRAIAGAAAAFAILTVRMWLHF